MGVTLAEKDVLAKGTTSALLKGMTRREHSMRA